MVFVWNSKSMHYGGRCSKFAFSNFESLSCCFSRNCNIRNFWIFFRTCFQHSRTWIDNFIEFFPWGFEKTRSKNHDLDAISTNHIYSEWKSILWTHGIYWTFSVIDTEHHAGTLRNVGGTPEFISLWCLQTGVHVVFILSKNAGSLWRKFSPKIIIFTWNSKMQTHGTGKEKRKIRRMSHLNPPPARDTEWWISQNW